MTALLVVACLAGLGAALAVARLQGVKAELRLAVDAAQKAAADALAHKQALRMAEAARADERARMEYVVTTLKREVAALEHDLQSCSDPAAIRERLRRLLAPGDPPQRPD